MNSRNAPRRERQDGRGGPAFYLFTYFSSLDRREKHRTSHHPAWKLRESIIPSPTNMAMVDESHGVAHVRSRRLPRDAGRRVDARSRDPVDPGPRSVHVAPIFHRRSRLYLLALLRHVRTSASHNEGNKHTACSTNDVRKQIVSSVCPFKIALQAPSGQMYFYMSK